MDIYQKYIHISRYARRRDDLGRRETFAETVDRYIDFWNDRFPGVFPSNEVRESILSLSVMPSMRAFMTAGKALARDEIAGYNCSFIPVDHPRAFDEALYVLMCGTGVGFSVESENVKKLLTVPDHFTQSDSIITVPDSKIGWSESLRELIAMLYAGRIPKWDLSKIRAYGSVLKTFGGRASGPDPLDRLLTFTVETFKRAAGRKLRPIECHDLMCSIAESVIVGGVRRSALISLSDLNDDDMRNAKSGNWWETNPQRALANNSAVYNEKPDMRTFFEEWHSLFKSGSGERGIFNRDAAIKKIAASGKREFNHRFGVNPCGEIILRPYGLCNLSEIVARSDDTPHTLAYKAKIAAIIGTFQSTLTNFRYVRNIWKKNAEEERLLGVSLTGIYDNPNLAYPNPDILKMLKTVVEEVNAEYADRLGINRSVAMTCVKPSGTVSQMVNSASGIHPRFAEYYIRRVRNDKKDPLTEFMVREGFPHEEDTYNNSMMVFQFPIKSPPGSIFRNNLTTHAQLNNYLAYRKNWCDHNPSITVYVKPNEWLGTGDWVYNNFDEIGGVAFLPYADHIYKQAPYEEVTESEYLNLLERMPIGLDDFNGLGKFELYDQTTGAQELACSAGVCEI